MSFSTDGRLYVLNTGVPNNVTGFSVTPKDQLTPIFGSTRPLSAANTKPAQVGISDDGESRIVTERERTEVSIAGADRRSVRVRICLASYGRRSLKGGNQLATRAAPAPMIRRDARSWRATRASLGRKQLRDHNGTFGNRSPCRNWHAIKSRSGNDADYPENPRPSYVEGHLGFCLASSLVEDNCPAPPRYSMTRQTSFCARSANRIKTTAAYT